MIKAYNHAILDPLILEWDEGHEDLWKVQRWHQGIHSTLITVYDTGPSVDSDVLPKSWWIAS